MRYIFPFVLCFVLLCGCMSAKTDKVNIAFYNSDGTAAKEYSTADEVISDSYENDGNDSIPDIIDGGDVYVAKNSSVSVGNKGDKNSDDSTSAPVEYKDDDNNTESTSVSVGYIGNKNSKIFHIEDCYAARKIKEENQIFASQRDEFVLKGYTPCKICNP